MEQQTKDQYITYLMSATWQEIKEEAELYGVRKESDDKWKDLIPGIAEVKFAVPSLTEEKQEFLDTDLVTEIEEVPVSEPKAAGIGFDYVRQGVTRNCQTCGYQIRVSLTGVPICPVSNPDCPRPSPNEV